MRRIYRLAGLCLAAGVGSACSAPDEVITTTAIPTAGVRFINAVPDTGAMDMRFVDLVENNAHWNVGFRNTPIINPTGANGVPAATNVQFKNAKAGSRRFKIFMYGTTVAVASDEVIDTTVTLTAGKNYTALLWGYANPTGPGRPPGASAMQLFFFEEDAADPGTNVALRVINADTGSLDVRYYAVTGGTAPGTTLALGVARLTKSTYVTTTPQQVRFNVRRAGAAVDYLTPDRIALIGDSARVGAPGPIEALPGTTQAGSAITAIVFPPSVACGTVCGAPQGTGSATVPSWTVPSIVYFWDRRPPRPAGI